MKAKIVNSARGGPGSGDDAGVGLKALFARAREHPPTAEQLTAMLRGVPRRMPRRRWIWRVGGATLAVAAAIAGGLVLLVPLHPQPAFAFSRVVEELRRMPVVEQRSYNGLTTWEGRGRFWAIHNVANGSYEYRDFVRETVATYTEKRGSVIISTCDTLPWPVGVSGPGSIDDLIQEAEAWGRALDIRQKIVDGRHVIEVRSTRRGDEQEVVTIDGDSGRIIKIQRGSVSTDYAYEAEAPRDLFDIGVPRGAAVLDYTAPPEVMALRDAFRVYARGFGAYRLVVPAERGGGGILRVITDGRRIRCEMFALDDEERTYTVDELHELAWPYDNMEDLAARATEIGIFDGETEQSVHYDPDRSIRWRHVRPKVNAVMTRSRTLLAFSAWTFDEDAFFGTWPDQKYEYVRREDRGWVGYRELGQANNCSRPYGAECFLDPRHGYAPCFFGHDEDPQAEWQLTPGWQKVYEAGRERSIIVRPPADAPAGGWEWEVIEWAELRPGQWYPAVARSGDAERAADGTWHIAEPAEGEGGHAGKYQVLVATPLETVDGRWFEVPAEWAQVSPTTFP